MSFSRMQAVKEFLDERYAAAQGPFTIEGEGEPDYLVMRTSDLELVEPDLTEPEKALLKKGFSEYLAGDVADAREFASELRGYHAV